MAFETILFEIENSVAAITLNRPGQAEFVHRRNARGAARGVAARARRQQRPRAADHRQRPRILRGAGLERARDVRERSGVRRRHHARGELQPAGAGSARAADPGAVCGERGSGRRRLQLRARLRRRHCRTLRSVYRSVQPHRTDPGCRRHLRAAAAGRAGARHGDGAARGTDPGRAGTGLGPDLEVRGRRPAHARGAQARRCAGSRGQPAASRSPNRRSTPRRETAWRSSSRWRRNCSARRRAPPISAKGCRRFWRSGRRAFRASEAQRTAHLRARTESVQARFPRDPVDARLRSTPRPSAPAG